MIDLWYMRNIFCTMTSLLASNWCNIACPRFCWKTGNINYKCFCGRWHGSVSVIYWLSFVDSLLEWYCSSTSTRMLPPKDLLVFFFDCRPFLIYCAVYKVLSLWAVPGIYSFTQHMVIHCHRFTMVLASTGTTYDTVVYSIWSRPYYMIGIQGHLNGALSLFIICIWYIYAAVYALCVI